MSWIVFLALTACAALGGVLFEPGSWYEELRKPAWTPPRIVFPIAWTILYVMIAVSGRLIWSASGFSPALTAWGIQLVLNGLWSWLFFGLHRPDLALVDIVALLVAIVATFMLAWPLSASAAWLLVPYALWVAFATALNFEIWRAAT